MTTVAIYMAAPECLKSHSLNLWGQQFYCWLLPAQIYLLLFRPNLALLVLSTFVACLGDWTPYVASTGMAGLGLYSYGRTRDRQALRIALALLAGCAAAGLTMVAWFHTRMSFADYFANLAMRSSARADGPVLGLLPTYLNSFGLFAVFAFLVLAWRPWRAGLRQAVPRRQVILPGVDPLVIAAAIYAIALLENVLMKGHALRYSYDRLKGVQLLAILVAWAVLESPRRANLALRLALLLGLASIALFWFSFDTPRGWSYIAHSQQERLGAIMAQTSSPEGPAFFNWEVRGAEVYYAGRNIFQIAEEAASRANTDLPTFAADWSRDHGFREGTVYQISGHYPQPFPEELPRELKVTRVFASAPPIVIGTFRLRETWQDYHPARNFYGLDPIWK